MWRYARKKVHALGLGCIPLGLALYRSAGIFLSGLGGDVRKPSKCRQDIRTSSREKGI